MYAIAALSISTVLFVNYVVMYREIRTLRVRVAMLEHALGGVTR